MRTIKRDWDWVLNRPKIVGFGGLVFGVTFLWHLQFSLVLTIAVAEIGYGLWGAPTVCGGATAATTTCRNNGRGMIRGCWIQEHNEQRSTTYVQRRDWHQVEHYLRRNNVVTSLPVGSVALVLSAVGWMVEGLVRVL